MKLVISTTDKAVADIARTHDAARGDDTLSAGERVVNAWLERIHTKHQTIHIAVHTKPADFPASHVVRAYHAHDGRVDCLTEYLVFTELHDAIGYVSWYFGHLHHMPRNPLDPPTLVGTWI